MHAPTFAYHFCCQSPQSHLPGNVSKKYPHTPHSLHGRSIACGRGHGRGHGHLAFCQGCVHDGDHDHHHGDYPSSRHGHDSPHHPHMTIACHRIPHHPRSLHHHRSLHLLQGV